MFLKKSFTFALSLVFVFALFGLSNVFAQSVPKVTATANKKGYKPGASGYLTIKFKTASNVKIPTEPQVDININGEGITGTGLKNYPGGDYISDSKVQYGFDISGNAESGSTITVTGSVKFGYCNSDSGVCKIATQRFSVKIKIK